MEKLLVDINNPVINLDSFRSACENLPVSPSESNYLALGLFALGPGAIMTGMWISEMFPIGAIVYFTLLVMFFYLAYCLCNEIKLRKTLISPVEFCGAPLFQTRDCLTNLCAPLHKMGIQALKEKPSQKVRVYLQAIEPHRTLVLLDEMVIDHYLMQE